MQEKPWSRRRGENRSPHLGGARSQGFFLHRRHFRLVEGDLVGKWQNRSNASMKGEAGMKKCIPLVVAVVLLFVSHSRLCTASSLENHASRWVERYGGARDDFFKCFPLPWGYPGFGCSILAFFSSFRRKSESMGFGRFSGFRISAALRSE